MLFGFGKGKIEVVLENYNFSSGETIKGKVILELKEPLRAKALKVGLIGEKIVYERTSQGRDVPRIIHIYSFEMPLDGEKEYLNGEYNFEIKIPADILQSRKPNILGDIDFIKGGLRITSTNERLSWYVIAKLDIPMGIDVSKKVQVNIS